MKKRPISIRRKVEIAIDASRTPIFTTFDGFEEHKEHIALIFSHSGKDEAVPPLVRVHSECLTGDVFGSRHCDCGAQLRYATDMISREGGVLVYLRQEGRGIGLNAKIDAYDLQSKGYDTFAANRALGHPEDARDFGVAADILRALGIGKIRLITGNPEKVDALRKEGIDIVGVLDTPAFETQENAAYLRAKRDRYDCETNERDEDRK